MSLAGSHSPSSSIATLSPIEARRSSRALHFEHFAAFAVVGIAFALAYPNRSCLSSHRRGERGRPGGIATAHAGSPWPCRGCARKALGGIGGIGVGQLAQFSARPTQTQSDPTNSDEPISKARRSDRSCDRGPRPLDGISPWSISAMINVGTLARCRRLEVRKPAQDRSLQELEMRDLAGELLEAALPVGISLENKS